MWQTKPFVGRDQEMVNLRAVVDEALAGRGGVIVISGEPGIGKTRTAQEVGAYAADEGARVLWGRCYEEQGVPPYWPWVLATLGIALGVRLLAPAPSSGSDE